MVSPILIHRPNGLKFFWNIDGNVGVASPNRLEDVQLIELGYSIMSRAPVQPQELRAVFSQVVVGSPCTGRDDDPLVKAIRAHQAFIGGTQDSHVSVIRANNGVYADSGGPHPLMLIRIINNIFDAMPADFPRIDKHPECPQALKAAVVASITR